MTAAGRSVGRGVANELAKKGSQAVDVAVVVTAAPSLLEATCAHQLVRAHKDELMHIYLNDFAFFRRSKWCNFYGVSLSLHFAPLLLLCQVLMRISALLWRSSVKGLVRPRKNYTRRRTQKAVKD